MKQDGDADPSRMLMIVFEEAIFSEDHYGE